MPKPTLYWECTECRWHECRTPKQRASRLGRCPICGARSWEAKESHCEPQNAPERGKFLRPSDTSYMGDGNDG